MRHAVHPPPESLIHRRSGQQMMMVGTLAFQPPAQPPPPSYPTHIQILPPVRHAACPAVPLTNTSFP